MLELDSMCSQLIDARTQCWILIGGVPLQTQMGVVSTFWYEDDPHNFPFTKKASAAVLFASSVLICSEIWKQINTELKALLIIEGVVSTMPWSREKV